MGSGCSAASSAWPAAVKASRSGIGAAKLFDRVRHADTARAAMEARYGSVLEAVTLSEESPPVPVEVGNVVSMRLRA